MLPAGELVEAPASEARHSGSAAAVSRESLARCAASSADVPCVVSEWVGE